MKMKRWHMMSEVYEKVGASTLGSSKMYFKAKCKRRLWSRHEQTKGVWPCPGMNTWAGTVLILPWGNLDLPRGPNATTEYGEKMAQTNQRLPCWWLQSCCFPSLGGRKVYKAFPLSNENWTCCFSTWFLMSISLTPCLFSPAPQHPNGAQQQWLQRLDM